MSEKSAIHRRGPLRIIAAALLLVWAALAVLHDGPPAAAANRGYMVDIGGWMVGTFVSSNGAHTYCVEPGTSEPVAAQRSPRETGTLPGYTGYQPDATGWNAKVTSGPASGETVRRMNYVMWQYGRTTNADQAASVQLAIWLIRDDPGVRDWLEHRLKWVRDHGRGDLIKRAETYVAEARAQARAPQNPSPGALTLRDSKVSADETGVVTGTGTVAYPAGTTRLTISGAEFAGGKTSLAISGGRAGSVSWQARLHSEKWEREHRVSVSGAWEAKKSGWPASVVVHPASQENQQWLGSGVSPVDETVRADLKSVTVALDSQFSPELTTEVPERFVERESGVFSDTVSVTVGEGSAPWAARRNPEGDAEFAPVTAEGELFGPFDTPLEESEAPPEGAPVAAHAEIVADRGPGTYEVDADPPVSSGYYSWVWSVREDRQTEEIRAAELLPNGYAFSDRFGVEAEGQTVPTALRWTTQLVESRIGLDDMRVRDRLTPESAHGPWLRDAEGHPLPAVLTLTAYHSAAEPEQSAEVPEDATVIGSTQVTVGADGETVEAEPIDVPFETRGWVTVRTCLNRDEQVEESREYFEEWCDDYGIPSETAKIAPPEVVTEAQPQALVGETIRDNAIVTGRVPADSTVGFRFYLLPEPGAPKFDADWKPLTDDRGRPKTWSRDELAGMSDAERCTAQPVATTSRVAVAGPGSIPSPEVTARSAGTGYWVEDLDTAHPESGERVGLHRGECGLENERTAIAEPGLPLARTGGDFALVGIAGGAAAGVLAAILLWAGRRHAAAARKPGEADLAEILPDPR